MLFHKMIFPFFLFLSVSILAQMVYLSVFFPLDQIMSFGTCLYLYSLTCFSVLTSSKRIYALKVFISCIVNNMNPLITHSGLPTLPFCLRLIQHSSSTSPENKQKIHRVTAIYYGKQILTKKFEQFLDQDNSGQMITLVLPMFHNTTVSVKANSYSHLFIRH